MSETIEVHNVWTLYGLDENGEEVEEPMACLHRPQDWGDPRWIYNQFRFDWITGEKHYINHIHCWTDIKRKQHEYPEMFAPLIVHILQPGCTKEFCGREYLHPEDFWQEGWGKMPPVHEEDEDDWFEEGW